MQTRRQLHPLSEHAKLPSVLPPHLPPRISLRWQQLGVLGGDLCVLCIDQLHRTIIVRTAAHQAMSKSCSLQATPSNSLDSRLPVVGNFGLGSGQEESDIEVEFVTPRRFTFPDVEVTPTGVTTAASHKEESPDTSSLTGSAHHGSHPSSHRLHVTPFSPHGIARSVSCNALPLTAQSGYRGVDKPDSPEKYVTPRSLRGSPSKFPAFYRAYTRVISGETKHSWSNLNVSTASVEISLSDSDEPFSSCSVVGQRSVSPNSLVFIILGYIKRCSVLLLSTRDRRLA